MNTVSPILTEEELEAEFEKPDNTGRELLAAGHPIVYRDPDTPAGRVVKHFPDGHRELWTYRAGEGEGVKVGDMPPESA